jgi:hypothetical protein
MRNPHQFPSETESGFISESTNSLRHVGRFGAGSRSGAASIPELLRPLTYH